MRKRCRPCRKIDTFVPVLLQAGHPLWQNDTDLELSLTGFALG
ncbi:MAG: hypothetical protein R3E79_52985 [Caldilineaceae bacterium]